MAESFPFFTFTVLGGGSCAAWVVCVALDMPTTPPVAVTATRTAAPASTQLFRFTGPPGRLHSRRDRGTSPSLPGAPECSDHPSLRRMGFDSCRRGAHLGWGPGSPS